MGVFGGMAKMNGYIQLHRSILNWEWYSDSNTRDLFIHCLLKANFIDTRWQGVIVDKGSFITSQHNLAKELGISIQNVRTSLTHLKSTGELTVKQHSKYSVISIKNWDSYQSTNSLANSQLTGNQQATNNSVINKEYKKEINNNINTPTPFIFDEKVIKELSEQFGVSKTFVQDTYAQMKDWMASKGKTYKDEKAGFRNWLRSKAKENGIIPKPQIIHKEKTPHQIIAELEAKERIQNANN